MNELEWAIDAITIGSTGAAFVIFFIYMGERREPGPESTTDFGIVFAAFLAGWLATEFFEVLTDPISRDTGRLVHFMLLLALAAWLNARLFSVVRHARSGDEKPGGGGEAAPKG